MNEHEARETRGTQAHPDAEQRGIVTDVVVPLAAAAINTGGLIYVAKMGKKDGDGNK
jgi:hypothetical protein